MVGQKLPISIDNLSEIVKMSYYANPFARLTILAVPAFWGPHASAADVDVAIVFAVDVSASIGSATADLQREGHATAIGSPEVVAAIARNRTGCIAITYFEWASQGHKRMVVPWTSVCGLRDAQVVASVIRMKGGKGYGCRGGCRTSLSYAIDLGSLLLDSFAGDASSEIIDISANGTNNDGLPVQQSRLRAIAKGYTINAIAIPAIMGGVKHDYTSYFVDNVIGGPNAFVITPAITSDYTAALRRKLVDEISLSKEMKARE